MAHLGTSLPSRALSFWERGLRLPAHPHLSQLAELMRSTLFQENFNASLPTSAADSGQCLQDGDSSFVATPRESLVLLSLGPSTHPAQSMVPEPQQMPGDLLL